MGTKKRKFYRGIIEDTPQTVNELAPQEDQEEEDEVGMRVMLIGSVVVIIILIVAFFSPNF